MEWDGIAIKSESSRIDGTVSATCIECWRASYQKSDWTERQILIEAISYGNYLASPVDIQGLVEGLVVGQDCAQIPRNGIHVQQDHACLGPARDLSGRDVYLFLSKPLFPKPGGNAVQPPDFLADSLINDTQRLVLFVSDWIGTSGENELGSPEEVDCVALMIALGLCDAPCNLGRSVTILKLNVKEAHVPTWLDGDLFFFWYPAADGATSGLSRSLDTGMSNLHEWVVTKEAGAFDVEAYWHRQLDRDCSLGIDDLSLGFWDGCTRSIEGQRQGTTNDGGS